jgi:hypothetical protein
VALSSSERAFGGISDLRVEADGAHFLAVTDNGSWLRGRIVYSDGRPSGIADAEMAPLLGPDGSPLAARGWYDAESLENDNGTLCVGLERVETIVRFDYAREGLAARARVLPVPEDFRTFTLQQEPGMPGHAAASFPARRHADHDHRAQPRHCRQQPRLSARPDAHRSA